MEGMEGKEITLFYDDDTGISRKDGTLLGEENGWLHLKLYNDKEILIDRNRIVRIELKRGSP